MRPIELLAPARNADIGIAAIDCGADAVYIAGPQFGARKDAANPVSEIKRLCDYASKFGVRVFVTFNILLRDDELPLVHTQMLECQEVGASAFIIRDPRLCLFPDIKVPLHASTQCSIRDISRARLFQEAGCGRVVLERQLSLEQIRQISSGLDCEVECFVHGALCVGYSGGCTLSESLTGRSADRGECIQACRNLYDLVDENGHVWLKNKALLSLKDLNLSKDLYSLLQAGVTSLKIEGRLKNMSYVRNVTRHYSLLLDSIIAAHPEEYRRASFGRVVEGFTPALDKTFNRSYTRLCLEEDKSDWANFEAPKSMGEMLAMVKKVVEKRGTHTSEITLDRKVEDLSNGDGFAFIDKSQIVGFRADVCRDGKIVCRAPKGLVPGVLLYRNLNRAFEKYMEGNPCRRCIRVEVWYGVDGEDAIFSAVSEDGRSAEVRLKAHAWAVNVERAKAMYHSQIGKRTEEYVFKLDEVAGESLPLAHLSSSQLNSVRRDLAQRLSAMPCRGMQMCNPSSRREVNYEIGRRDGELLRSKYCIRAQIGQCLKENGSKGALYLVNNSRRFPLLFDCHNCEMVVLQEIKTASKSDPL